MTEWEKLGTGPYFASARLDCALHGCGGARFRRDGEDTELALPYAPQRPFPLTELFCFARITELGGRKWAVYRLDKKHCPIF